MILFATIFLAVIVAWALARPHFELAEESASVNSAGGGAKALQAGAQQLTVLLDQKSRCMQLLKDLELDFSTGKISESDHDRMRGTLNTELGALLTRIDESSGHKR